MSPESCRGLIFCVPIWYLSPDLRQVKPLFCVGHDLVVHAYPEGDGSWRLKDDHFYHFRRALNMLHSAFETGRRSVRGATLYNPHASDSEYVFTFPCAIQSQMIRVVCEEGITLWAHIDSQTSADSHQSNRPYSHWQSI